MNGKKLEELTYADDKLERNEEFGNGVSSLINNSKKVTNNNSLVLALDSGWGTGKTVFLHMLMNDLKQKGCRTIYYNAWENDDWDSALIPIVARIKDIRSQIPNDAEKQLFETIEDKSNKIGVFLKNNWGKISFNITSGFFKKITSVDLQQIKKMYDDVTKEQNLTKDYDNFISAKSDFKQELEKLSKDKKVIFLIDELDRCKPTFAIETLEVIKHFFDVKNFVFVFALDMQQLSHSIKTNYGQEMDAPGYLRRFFDMQLLLPKPLMDKYVNLKTTNNFRAWNNIGIDGNTITERISILFSHFDLSLRDVDIIFNNLTIFLNFNKEYFQNDSIIKLKVYLFLIILKYKDTEAYNTILHQNYNTNSTQPLYVPASQVDDRDIDGFLSCFANGNMQKDMWEIENNPTFQIQFARIRLQNPDENDTVSTYVERKLEILGFPKSSEKDSDKKERQRSHIVAS